MTPRAVAGLIPHTGPMCLLDQVVECNDDYIVCSASSHRAAANPLRVAGTLPATAAIEYGAQAMACHGAMLGGGAARPGMLAAARNIKFSLAQLDQLQGDLRVIATALARGSDGLVYDFTIDCDGAAVASGRLTVMLAA